MLCYVAKGRQLESRTCTETRKPYFPSLTPAKAKAHGLTSTVNSFLYNGHLYKTDTFKVGHQVFVPADCQS